MTKKLQDSENSIIVSTDRNDQLKMVESIIPLGYLTLMRFMMATNLPPSAKISAMFFVGRIKENLDSEAAEECFEFFRINIPEYFHKISDKDNKNINLEEVHFLLAIYNEVKRSLVF